MEIINKNKNLLIFFLIIVLGFILFYFLLHKNVSENVLKTEDINFVKIGGQKIKVELASTSEKQEKGLSGREKIGENEGMLFIFENSGIHLFWMKDMNFPIDIIWLNKEKKIVFLKENVLPTTFPESFSGEKDSKYVLEVFAGFSKKNNLKLGEVAQFLP
jgi:uncharacterized protein